MNVLRIEDGPMIYMLLKRYFTLLLVLSLPLMLTSQSQPWKFLKEKEGIKVYTRASPSSKIKEVKIITTFDASLSTIKAILADLDSYSKWVYAVTETRLVKKYDEGEMDYYNILNFPWPMRNRDVVIHTKMVQDPHTKVIFSKSEAIGSKLPIDDKYIRIDIFSSSWTFTPIKGKVNGEYIFNTDPGGIIPAWAVNMALDEGPIKTILKLKALMKEDKYQIEKTASIISQ